MCISTVLKLTNNGRTPIGTRGFSKFSGSGRDTEFPKLFRVIPPTQKISPQNNVTYIKNAVFRRKGEKTIKENLTTLKVIPFILGSHPLYLGAKIEFIERPPENTGEDLSFHEARGWEEGAENRGFSSRSRKMSF